MKKDISNNTLLKPSTLPSFAKIKTEDMFSGIKYLVEENKRIIKEIESIKKLSWRNFMAKIKRN